MEDYWSTGTGGGPLLLLGRLSSLTSFVNSTIVTRDRVVAATSHQFDSLSVLVARGRAKVSAAAAASDWPKRIRDMQHIDVDEHFD